MATEAQIHANRKNAGKSTGPKTAEGKAKVSQNAVTHGLRAQRDIIIGEDPAEFAAHRRQLLAELAPVGAMQTMLAERVVHLSWRLRRAERIQNEVFDALHAKVITSPIAKLIEAYTPKGPDGVGTFGPDGEDYALGRVVLRDFSNCRVLDHLLMYERRIENSLYRAMAELRKLQLLHEIDPPTEKPTARVARGAGGEPIVPNKANVRAEISPLRPSACGQNDTNKAVCGAHPTPSASGRNDTAATDDRAKQSQSAMPRALPLSAQGQACHASRNDSKARGANRAKQSQLASADRR